MLVSPRLRQQAVANPIPPPPQALTYPMKLIASNAGVNGSVVMQKVIDSNDPNYGYNAAIDKFENLMDSGIIDPTKVRGLDYMLYIIYSWFGFDSLSGVRALVGARSRAPAASAAACGSGPPCSTATPLTPPFPPPR